MHWYTYQFSPLNSLVLETSSKHLAQGLTHRGYLRSVYLAIFWIPLEPGIAQDARRKRFPLCQRAPHSVGGQAYPKIHITLHVSLMLYPCPGCGELGKEGIQKTDTPWSRRQEMGDGKRICATWAEFRRMESCYGRSSFVVCFCLLTLRYAWPGTPQEQRPKDQQ